MPAFELSLAPPPTVHTTISECSLVIIADYESLIYAGSRPVAALHPGERVVSGQCVFRLFESVHALTDE